MPPQPLRDQATYVRTYVHKYGHTAERREGWVGKAHTHALQLTLSEARSTEGSDAQVHMHTCTEHSDIRTYVHTYTHMYSMIYVRMYVVSQFTPTQDIHTYVYVSTLEKPVTATTTLACT